MSSLIDYLWCLGPGVESSHDFFLAKASKGLPWDRKQTINMIWCLRPVLFGGEGSWMFSLKILRLFLDLVDLWGLRFIDYWAWSFFMFGVECFHNFQFCGLYFRENSYAYIYINKCLVVEFPLFWILLYIDFWSLRFIHFLALHRCWDLPVTFFGVWILIVCLRLNAD